MALASMGGESHADMASVHDTDTGPRLVRRLHWLEEQGTVRLHLIYCYTLRY